MQQPYEKATKLEIVNEMEWQGGLDFLDEDSINQQTYIERFERDLSMGFPRYIASSVFE